MLAQAGDGSLLRGAPLQLCLGLFALGDVREHAVPARAAEFVGDEQRIVADPDHPAVAMQHPIFDGGARVRSRDPARRLTGQHALTVEWVKPGAPQGRVKLPLLGRETQDQLDLRTDVVPSTVLAGLRHVDDRGDAVEQRAEVPRRFAEPDGLELDRGGPRRRIEQFLLVPRQAARELIRGGVPSSPPYRQLTTILLRNTHGVWLRVTTDADYGSGQSFDQRLRVLARDVRLVANGHTSGGIRTRNRQ